MNHGKAEIEQLVMEGEGGKGKEGGGQGREETKPSRAVAAQSETVGEKKSHPFSKPSTVRTPPNLPSLSLSPSPYWWSNSPNPLADYEFRILLVLRDMPDARVAWPSGGPTILVALLTYYKTGLDACRVYPHLSFLIGS